MLGNDPTIPARRLYLNKTDKDYEKKKKQEEERESKKVVSSELFTHEYQIVLNKWRFDWKTVSFPWKQTRSYSMCHLPSFELLGDSLKNKIDSDPVTWNCAECCTVKEFGSLQILYKK